MKLSLRQIKALKASISHWKRNASASSFDEVQISPESCALCKNYYATSCKNCPVKLHAKKSFCVGTPWERCSCSKMCGDFLSFIEAAQAELRFLQSILAEAGQ